MPSKEDFFSCGAHLLVRSRGTVSRELVSLTSFHLITTECRHTAFVLSTCVCPLLYFTRKPNCSQTGDLNDKAGSSSSGFSFAYVTFSSQRPVEAKHAVCVSCAHVHHLICSCGNSDLSSAHKTCLLLTTVTDCIWYTLAPCWNRCVQICVPLQL